MNYQNYANRPQRRKQIWSDFAIEDFFSVYSSAISAIPIESCIAIDASKYAKDWATTSQEVRVRANWRCAICDVQIRHHRRLLHAHHVDRDKSNNWLYNLKPLCALCHKEQPGHTTMYVSVKDRQIIEELRREQGLT